MVDVNVLRQENSIVQNKFHSLKDTLILLVLVTTITVTPIIEILKQIGRLYKGKGVPQNEMGICFISEQCLPPLQLELTAKAGEHSKHIRSTAVLTEL